MDNPIIIHHLDLESQQPLYFGQTPVQLGKFSLGNNSEWEQEKTIAHAVYHWNEDAIKRI